jgi:hypothetical protein
LKRNGSRLSTRALAVALWLAVAALAAPHAARAQAPAPDFGTGPSGVVPIIYNDHHVYAKPDTLRKGRVLAALVRGTEIFVPLRSMFEQMGATVSYDPATRKIDVSKPGESLQLTVGKPELIINGESKPLDVGPRIFRGVVVVPVRVISEGLGAYVQWLPDRRIVVIRYVSAAVPAPPPPTEAPAPPPPTAAPTLAPTPVPTPVPTPAPPKGPSAQVFVVGDYLFDPKVYNEFSPGNTGTGASFAGRAGVEIPVSKLTVLFEADGRQYQYPHDSVAGIGCIPTLSYCCPQNPGCVTTIGHYGQTYVPAFTARDSDLDARIGIGVPIVHVSLDVSYLRRWTNYGYPTQNGVGFGLEKLPDFKSGLSIFGSFFYYPQVSGNYTDSAASPYYGQTWNLAYHIYRYDGGVHLNLGETPLFVEAGYMGDRGIGNVYAPDGFTHSAFNAGVGLHF